MIMTILNLTLAIVGSIALAVAVFLLINQRLQCVWSRHWLRERLSDSRVLPSPTKLLATPCTAGNSLAGDVALSEEMANFLDAVGHGMHMGSSPTAAFIHSYQAFPRLVDYLQPIARSCERGLPLTEALRSSESDSRSAVMPPSVVFGFRALWAATTGSTGALSLERAAATLRDRTAIHYERHAQSAQARLSVQILTWLPVIFLGWQLTTNPLARWFLLASPTGWILLVGGLALNWYGRHWMNRVVQGTR